MRTFHPNALKEKSALELPQNSPVCIDSVHLQLDRPQIPVFGKRLALVPRLGLGNSLILVSVCGNEWGRLEGWGSRKRWVLGLPQLPSGGGWGTGIVLTAHSAWSGVGSSWRQECHYGLNMVCPQDNSHWVLVPSVVVLRDGGIWSLGGGVLRSESMLFRQEWIAWCGSLPSFLCALFFCFLSWIEIVLSPHWKLCRCQCLPCLQNYEPSIHLCFIDYPVSGLLLQPQESQTYLATPGCSDDEAPELLELCWRCNHALQSLFQGTLWDFPAFFSLGSFISLGPWWQVPKKCLDRRFWLTQKGLEVWTRFSAMWNPQGFFFFVIVVLKQCDKVRREAGMRVVTLLLALLLLIVTVF
jgi:hypothetical protein